MKKILVSGRYKNRPKVFALVDDEDFERISQYTWYMNSKDPVKRYAYCFPNKLHKEILMMARLVVGIEETDKRIPDHINHDTLDNRKTNLRIVSRSTNSYNMRFKTKLSKSNTCGYRGVCKLRGRWVAYIQRKHLGSFGTPEEAAKAYDARAKKTFGRNAILNFP